MNNDEASDRSNLLALIGPLPEQPQAPEAPTPWRVNLPNYAEQILDASGRSVGDFANEAVAALVVELVNTAAAAEQAPEREVDHYVDEDGTSWALADNGRYYIAPTREVANAKLSQFAHRSGDHGCTLEHIVGGYGATPVYKS